MGGPRGGRPGRGGGAGAAGALVVNAHAKWRVKSAILRRYLYVKACRSLRASTCKVA